MLNNLSNIRNVLSKALLFCALVWATSGNWAVAGPHLLVETKSGNVLAQKDATHLWPPASLTKLMTAYTIFRQIEAGRITKKSPVRVSSNALAQPPSKMGFPVGTILTIDAALNIIMVKSANDIAHALAQSSAGSVTAFVSAMNANAAALGMKDSHFTNPHGLPDFAQYTSAKDMALLALAIEKEFPQHAGYFNISHIKIGKRRLRNHNRLLFHIDGANGMKTGYICASGLNIVARVEREGRSLIAVVMGGPSSVERNVEAARLFDLGFDENSKPTKPIHLETLATARNQYRVPGNFTPEMCRPKWQTTKQTKKQRRAARKVRLAEIKALREKHFKEATGYEKIVKITLGGAVGPNPFNLRTAKGNTPPPLIASPVPRPERTDLPELDDTLEELAPGL